MAYQIIQTLLGAYNRPGTPLTPIGIVVHDTEGHNDTDEGNFHYFNSGDRSASAHYFADNDSISQFIPDHEEAWHACHSGNIRYLGLELCHFDDQARFEETWKRGVWLVAQKCVQYGWNPHNPEQVMTHKMVSDRFHESDHQDPVSYFAQHGKSFDNFIADVEAVVNTLRKPAPEKIFPAARKGVVEVLADRLNVRKTPSTTGGIITTVSKGEKHNFFAVENDWYDLGGGQWAYGNKGAYLKEEPLVQTPQHINLGFAGKQVFLPGSNDTWTAYKVNCPPVKSNPANVAGLLAPRKFGGLTYTIIKDYGNYVFEIHTQAFGNVKIYAAPDTGAVIR